MSGFTTSDNNRSLWSRIQGSGKDWPESLNYDVMKDLAEDEKIITIRKIEKLEINPVTGSYIGSLFTSSDRTRHDKFCTGYCVKIGNLWYPVRKEEFEAMQNATECEFHTAQHSHIFLDCTAII